VDPDLLQPVLSVIRERWGDDAVRKLDAASADISSLPTGFSALDGGLGGGVPRGRLTEVCGAPTCGLMSLAFQLIGSAQREGGEAVVIDVDMNFNPLHAPRYDVALEGLLLVRPQPRRHTLGILDDLVAREGAALIVLNAGILQPSSLTDVRTPSAAWSRLAFRLARTSAALVALRHLPSSGCSPEPSPFPDAAVRLHVERLRWLEDGGTVGGYESCVTVLKHRFGTPGGSATVAVGVSEPAA
jgi:hypothetical protein